MKTNSPKSFRMAATALATGLLAGVPSIPSARAATIDWSATAASGTWATGSNWVGGTAPIDDTTSDIARFNQTSYTNRASLFGFRSINGLIFGDGATATAAISLQVGNGQTNALTIGSAGIVMNANAGNSGFDGSGNIKLAGNQTWTNHSTNLLSVGAAISNAGSSPVTLALRGSGVITLGGAITDNGATGTLAIEIDKPGSTVNFNSATANTNFSGGLIVKSGTAIGNGVTALGLGPITLGASSGSESAAIGNSRIGFVSSSAINVAAGSSGTLTLFGTTGTTFAGAVTLNNNLTILGIGAVSLTGGISGTGNLTLGGSAGGLVSITTASLNINGTITASGSNTGGYTISGGIGSGVTSILLSSTTSGLTISTNALNVNSGGTILTTATTTSPAKVLTLSGGTVGTGDLILKNNTSTAGAVSVSTLMVNHEGAIINSGIGTGNVSISATIGSNVTGVRQASSTSALSVTGGVNVNGAGTTFRNAGGAQLSLSGTVSGVGNFTLENNSSLSNGINVTSLFRHTGLISNLGTGTGSVIISSNIGADVTGVVQDSATSTLILGGSNDYRGETLVRSGTLQINNVNALQFSTLDTGAVGTQAVVLGVNGTFNIGGLKGAQSITTGNAAGGNQFNIGGNNQSTAYSGAIGGNGKINKVGTGTLALSGSNAYSGGTIVTAGTLLINTSYSSGVTNTHSGTGSGGVNVTGGALGGIGIIRPGGSNKITVSSGAYITPGNRLDGTFGTLVLDGGGTTGALLTMNAGAKFSFRIGEDFTSDKIDLWNFRNGDLVLNNNVIEISIDGMAKEGTYNLFNFFSDDGEALTSQSFDSGLSVTFLNGGGVAAGYLEFNYGSIDLVVTTIPEPSTWALMACSFFLAVAYRRRSKHAV